ncbi:MAG: translation initiation factor 2 [Eubacteriales bacterium]
MVKGTTKQVVMVKPSGSDLFEQAIFIVKEGAGVTPEQVMEQANRAAKTYVRTKVHGGRGAGTAWLPLLTFLAGGGLSTLIWWIL